MSRPEPDRPPERERKGEVGLEVGVAVNAPATWEEAIGPILRAIDPVAALRTQRLGVGPTLCAELGAVDAAGLRVASLLAARLRYDRLLQRNAQQREAWNADPERFIQCFRRWHATTPPTETESEGPSHE